MGGEAFRPYLVRAVSDLLRIGARELRPKALDDEEDNAEVYFTVGDELCRFDATGLESKAAALTMLVIVANVSGPYFLPYVERVLAIALPLLTFEFNDEVQAAAAALVPVLVRGMARCLFYRRGGLNLKTFSLSF
jgi:hypothetical protein